MVGLVAAALWWAGPTSRSRPQGRPGHRRLRQRSSRSSTGRASGRSRRSSGYDLEDRYRRDTRGALASLERNRAARAPEAELVYALAELSWIEGRRPTAVGGGRPRPLDRYVDAVAYAYDFLFDPELAAGPAAVRPALPPGLRPLQRRARPADPRRPAPTAGSSPSGDDPPQGPRPRAGPPRRPAGLALEAGRHRRVAPRLRLRGHAASTPAATQYGLGVPLIGVRKPEEPEAKGAGPVLPARDGLPADGVPRPELAAPRPERRRRATARLHARPGRPGPASAIGRAAPTAMPVEADLTTPLAYMWSRTDLNRYRWTGLLRPGDAAERAGPDAAPALRARTRSRS